MQRSFCLPVFLVVFIQSGRIGYSCIKEGFVEAIDLPTLAEITWTLLSTYKLMS